MWYVTKVRVLIIKIYGINQILWHRDGKSDFKYSSKVLNVGRGFVFGASLADIGTLEIVRGISIGQVWLIFTNRLGCEE